MGEILLQRPISRSGFHLPSRLTEEDLAYMRRMAQQHFDRIMVVLKAMPRTLLLVIRSLFTTFLGLFEAKNNVTPSPLHLKKI